MIYSGGLGIWLDVHVLTETGVDLVHACQKLLVGGYFLQALIGNVRQKFNWIFVNLLPQIFVKTAEQSGGLDVPSPPKVVCQLVEFLQRFWNVAFDSHSLPNWRVCIAYFYVHEFLYFYTNYFSSDGRDIPCVSIPHILNSGLTSTWGFQKRAAA